MKHLQGQGCPKCQQSSGEQIINTVLKSFKINSKFQQIYY